MITDIEKIIIEKNIVCISPHYDDFLFFLGGYINEMKKANRLQDKVFTNVSTFSRSNYQLNDTAGNKDQSLARVQYATGIRIIEDLQCLDALLGSHNYHYRILGEEESQVRGGKKLVEGEGSMEMAVGNYDNMTGYEWEVLRRLEGVIKDIALQPDTALVLPSAMKGHIDHFIVREAGMRVMKRGGNNAAFYFAEDKPYAGLLTDEEVHIHEHFISSSNLEASHFGFDPLYIIEMAYKHYPSQVSDVYRSGIVARVEQFQAEYKTNLALDCIYKQQEV